MKQQISQLTWLDWVERVTKLQAKRQMFEVVWIELFEQLKKLYRNPNYSNQSVRE
jgi:hypothetical protein